MTMKIEQPWNDARLKVTKDDGSVVFIGCTEKQIADFIISLYNKQLSDFQCVVFE